MTEPKSNDRDPSTWASIIQSVRTPLGFFTLAVLVIEVILGILAGGSTDQDRTYLIVGMLVVILLLILLVAGLAIFRPEALAGLRPSGVVTAFQVPQVPPPPATEVSPDSTATQTEAIDTKLVRFIPPFHTAQFKIIDLPSFDPPKYYNWSYSPTGYMVVYGIPFFLLPVHDSAGSPRGHIVIDLQPTRENGPISDTIEVMVKDVRTAHFLLSAGHGWRTHEGVQFLYRRIGYIRFQFADDTKQTVNLVLGKNIREWAFGNSPDLVTEIDTSQAKPAWLSHDSTRRMDLLSVPMAGAPKTIRAIRVVAQFEDDHPGKLIATPAIIISAITLERSV